MLVAGSILDRSTVGQQLPRGVGNPGLEDMQKAMQYWSG